MFNSHSSRRRLRAVVPSTPTPPASVADSAGIPHPTNQHPPDLPPDPFPHTPTATLRTSSPKALDCGGPPPHSRSQPTGPAPFKLDPPYSRLAPQASHLHAHPLCAPSRPSRPSRPSCPSCPSCPSAPSAPSAPSCPSVLSSRPVRRHPVIEDLLPETGRSSIHASRSGAARWSNCPRSRRD